ncbi:MULTISPECIES: thiolase family protein [unclassified Minwuia]|jgi:acetyl-CoA acetyltransferase|uniref:thiolase family protein n=1 Tax=unclassified Minwuia TaxID=2618799 RepID=UPI0024793A15|nr:MULTISPECIES: thiolase family protein [unclassified Minwuia]MDF1733592.1 thiolase family protein [Minwuia sp.]
MTDAYIIGSFSTRFQKWPDKSFKDLTREAYLGALADAGMENGDDIEFGWFGNCGMWLHNDQGSIRGQVCFTPLVNEGLFPARVPMVNVEGACATASMALHGAWKDILSGQTDVSLAIGVEKIWIPDEPEKIQRSFYAGIDNFDPEEWQEYYRNAGEEAGKSFETGPDRTVFMDTYAMQACYHMKKHGTTQRQIAAGAAKNHNYGALNPNAQYQFPMTVDQVVEDRPVSFPLTRSMCSPIGDGAAAAVVVSEDYYKGLPQAVKDRAVKIRANALSGGKYKRLDEPSLSMTAAQKAYAHAGLKPEDVQVAEVHDATSFCEVLQVEMMGFCDVGEGGRFVEAGETGPGGKVPVNTSGGLVSKGHPVGATGLSMIYELTTQLRGEAGERQVPDARIALAENGGGVIGFEEAACSVTILERARD